MINKKIGDLENKILRNYGKYDVIVYWWYINEIADNIFYPELEIIGPKKRLNIKYKNSLNIIIIPKRGVGKSTLINVICREKKQKKKIVEIR